MMYTEEQKKYGFWTLNFLEDFFGEKITEVKEIGDRRNLRVSCTQLLIPAKEQNRILKEWINEIPKLEIDFLALTSHVPQKLIDAIGENQNLKGLYLKWTKAKKIEPIAKNTKLEYLRIGSGGSIEDIEKIGSLKKMKVLAIENTKKTSNYSFLKQLGNLEMLEIEGGMYTQLKVDTIDSFIGHLKNLILFQMAAVKCPKPDYKNLVKLKKLVNFLGPTDFDAEEYLKIKAALPGLKYDQVYYNELMKSNLNKID